MKSSIRSKMTLGIIGLITFFLLFSIIMNRFFLEKFYIIQTKKILVEIGKRADSYIGYDDYMDEMDRIERTKGVRILILSPEIDVIEEIRKMPEREMMMGKNRRERVPKIKMIQRYKEMIRDNEREIEKSKYIFHLRLDPDANMRSIEIIYKLKNGSYLSVSKPVVALVESAGIAFRFFIISGGVTLLLAIIFGMIFSQRFTKPVRELNNIAKLMTDMNFTAKYEGDNSDEIGELGDSINLLSEKLHETITELKEANKKLKDEIEHERKLEKMRKEFVSGVSHELKTPVALIQGYAEGLKVNVNDDNESRDFYCDVITDEAHKMAKMINELLNLAQLEYEDTFLEMKMFDIGEMAINKVAKYDIIFSEKGINVEINMKSGIAITGNEDKIEQVIGNYITNAINHCEGEKKISISLEREINGIKFTVFNTGKEIDNEKKERIWESFYKADEARSREYGGTGLGLSIVRAIIDKHKGEYGVENKGNGVEFWFRLYK